MLDASSLGQVWAAVWCASPFDSTATPSCRCTSTSRRPFGAVVVVSGIGGRWGRWPVGGPHPRAARILPIATVSTSLAKWRPMDITLVGMLPLLDASSWCWGWATAWCGPPSGSTATPSCRCTSTSRRPFGAVVVVSGIGGWWGRRPAGGPHPRAVRFLAARRWRPCPTTYVAYEGISPMLDASSLCQGWAAAWCAPPSGSTATPSCRCTSTSRRPFGAVVVVSGIGGRWGRWPVGGPHPRAVRILPIAFAPTPFAPPFTWRSTTRSLRTP